jgi:hypothetical protein
MLLASLTPSLDRDVADHPSAVREIRLKIQLAALRKIKAKLSHAVSHRRVYLSPGSKHLYACSSYNISVGRLKDLPENPFAVVGNPKMKVCVASAEADLPGLSRTTNAGGLSCESAVKDNSRYDLTD